MLTVNHIAAAGASQRAATAREILDDVPLGAFIAYSDGSPQPPARFKNKLSAWAP